MRQLRRVRGLPGSRPQVRGRGRRYRRRSAMTTSDAQPQSGAKYLLLGATVFLALGGLLMIFSASAVTGIKDHADTMYFVKRQAIFLALGSGVLVAACRLSLPRIRRIGVAVLAAGDGMLGRVLVMGRANMGSVRALNL